ncbi:MAG: DCC1-like thiol-disulfide oxidoreductase family protein [Deltaproteobacteria bacterium]|nr:DCC1-like thiol-disulfide oxidoreductase family protein [Deltaproteobacteria bacterium]
MSLAALVFDGGCGFCTWSARFIAKRAARPIRIVPNQLLQPGEYGFRLGEASSTVWWVTEHGTCFAGYRAIALALTACRKPWRAIGRFLLRAPVAPFAAAAYRVISRNRRWLPGAPPALPSA